LVSVPLSLGIALASGAPPICGLTSEVVAGLVFPFLGGAYVTVCGPAAGLAPILFTAITSLGNGDMVVGYHLVVGVILMTGLVQLVLTYLKAAKFSQIFPTAAIHGMLAAIGFLLFAKQLPNFIGAKFHAHEFFSIMWETPTELLHHLHTDVFSIGLICLLLLFQLSAPQLRGGVLRYIPPQLIVVIVGVILGHLYRLDNSFLV
jgi:carbonic anhydrase